MKKIAFLLVIITLLGGCSNEYDINERTVVQGIGIDILEDGKLLVTVQTLNKDSYSGIGGTKVPEKLAENYVLEGENVSDALKNLPLLSGKLPLYTHTRIIVISLEAAKKGIDGILDYFVRDPSCYAGVFVCVCSGKAEDIFNEFTDKESVPSAEIENAVGSIDFSPYLVSVKLYEAVKNINEKTTCAVLPVIETVKEPGEKTKRIRVSKTAVFERDKLKSFITDDQTFYLNLFNNNIRQGTFILKTEDENAGFRFYSSECNTELINNGNKNLRFKTEIKIVLDTVEIDSPLSFTHDKAKIKDLESKAEKSIKDGLTSFLYKMSADGTDCMRIGRIVLHSDYEKYSLLEKNFSEMLKNAEYNVKVDVTIRSTGQRI